MFRSDFIGNSCKHAVAALGQARTYVDQNIVPIKQVATAGFEKPNRSDSRGIDLDNRQVSNVVITRGLHTAMRRVQIQALEV